MTSRPRAIRRRVDLLGGLKGHEHGNSAHKGASNYDNVEELARGAMGDDKEAYRKEFLTLIELSRSMDERKSGGLSAEN